MCSWTLPCVSSLVPSVLHLSHGFQCSLHIEPPALRRKATTDKLVEKIVKHDSWPIQSDILSPPLLRLTSRKPLWLDLQPVDIKSRWRHNWKLTQVVNSHLVCDPTIQQPGFHLPLQHWSLLNRFCMEQGHCSACGKKWRLTDTDLCPCGETQTMFHTAPWQNWMAAYLSYTLPMKILFCGWPVTVYDTHTRRRRGFNTMAITLQHRMTIYNITSVLHPQILVYLLAHLYQLTLSMKLSHRCGFWCNSA